MKYKVFQPEHIIYSALYFGCWVMGNSQQPNPIRYTTILKLQPKTIRPYFSVIMNMKLLCRKFPRLAVYPILI